MDAEIDAREKLKELFETSYSTWKEDKKNLAVKPDEIYNAIVEAFRKKSYNEKMSTNERNWVNRYQCVRQDGKDMLQHNGKFIVKESSLFDFLYGVHIDKGHAGRDLMFYELKKDFDAISKEIITVFVKCCVTCELKKGKTKRGIVVRPLLSDDQNSRCQVDLIDYQAKPDGDYKFILVYQDHLTKFVILKPLKQKTGDAVAEMLIEIFSTFDAPRLLQSDNGKEFVNSVIKSLVARWPQCKKIQGKPRHSQSQGSVERANRDVGDILQTLMADLKTSHWASLLPQVQYAKNSRYHTGIKVSPFEAMFGRRPSGIRSNDVDEDADTTDANDVEGVETAEFDETEGVENDGTVRRPENETAEVEDSDSVDAADLEALNADDASETEDNTLTVLDLTHQQKAANLETARRGQKRQADRMLEASAKRFKPLEVGQTVRVPVADVDRAKTDARNILGVITEKVDDFYKVGTRQGEFEQLFARNQLEPTSENFMQVEEVPDIVVKSVRTVAAENSISGGQGHIHCNCKGGCQDRKCKCRRENRICNSRCHNSLTCSNK